MAAARACVRNRRFELREVHDALADVAGRERIEPGGVLRPQAIDRHDCSIAGAPSSRASSCPTLAAARPASTRANRSNVPEQRPSAAKSTSSTVTGAMCCCGRSSKRSRTSIVKQPADQIVRPGVDGQTGAIQPADGLVAGDQVAFVAKRVCGFLDLAIVRPRGLRVGGDSGQTREAFDEAPFEHGAIRRAASPRGTRRARHTRADQPKTPSGSSESSGDRTTTRFDDS